MASVSAAVNVVNHAAASALQAAQPIRTGLSAREE